MSRPIVVIPACTKLIEGHAFDAVGRKYSAAIAEVAECQPLLAPLGASMADIGAVLEVADAILLSGSVSNVAPEHYGEEAPIKPDAARSDARRADPSAHPRRDRAQDAVIRHLPRLPGAERRAWRQPVSGRSRRGRPQRPPRATTIFLSTRCTDPSTRSRFAANCATGSEATRSWSTRCTGRASRASPMG